MDQSSDQGQGVYVMCTCTGSSESKPCSSPSKHKGKDRHLYTKEVIFAVLYIQIKPAPWILQASILRDLQGVTT